MQIFILILWDQRGYSEKLDPRGMVGRFYIKGHYTLLDTLYESSGPCGFGEDFFLCFSHDAPGAGPVWTPGARLAGFIQRTTIQPPLVSPNVQTSRPETAALQPQYQSKTRSTTLAAAAYDNDNNTSAVSIFCWLISAGRKSAIFDLYNNSYWRQTTYICGPRYDICFVEWFYSVSQKL